MPVGIAVWLVNAAFFLMLAIGALIIGGLLFTTVCSLFWPRLLRFENITVLGDSDLRDEVRRRVAVLMDAPDSQLLELEDESVERAECGGLPAQFLTSRTSLLDGMTRIAVAGATIMFRSGVSWVVGVAAEGFDLGPAGTRTPISEAASSELAMDAHTSKLYKDRGRLSA
jgi:hypothetical protein